MNISSPRCQRSSTWLADELRQQVAHQPDTGVTAANDQARGNQLRSAGGLRSPHWPRSASPIASRCRGAAGRGNATYPNDWRHVRGPMSCAISGWASRLIWQGSVGRDDAASAHAEPAPGDCFSVIRRRLLSWRSGVRSYNRGESTEMNSRICEPVPLCARTTTDQCGGSVAWRFSALMDQNEAAQEPGQL